MDVVAVVVVWVTVYVRLDDDNGDAHKPSRCDAF
jgi:hypothetical protein